MKKLLLTAGLPGVGKTTVSAEVSRRVGAHVVDLDDFKRTDVDSTLVKSQIDPPELRWAYYQKALDHVFALFDQGLHIVIMDEVFHLDSLRTQLEALCEECHVQVLWIEVRCPYDVVAERLQSTKREGHILSTEEALKMHLMFKEIFDKFPTDHKNHIVVDNYDTSDVGLLVDSIVGKVIA